ncbi:thioredoxin family protein [Maribacter sp. 2304DJ31-5]|uniref:thioredoxin family protein n=1 Tax=Maribacter sp. 2304DJ31-5 TaxID=3386273 RepID=UPI0039BCCF7E
MNGTLRIVLNTILVLFTFSGIYLANATVRRFGLLLLIIVTGTFLFNFIKQKKLAIPYYFIGFIASSFILFKAVVFLIYAERERSKFDIPTAVVFETLDFDASLSKAKTMEKFVFIDFYASWCGPCLKFTKNVLTDADVGTHLNSTFINLKYDAEKGEGRIIAKRYGIKSYPTLLIVDGDGNEIERAARGKAPTKATVIALSEKYSQ